MAKGQLLFQFFVCAYLVSLNSWGQGSNLFVPNAGQFHPDIQYLVRIPGGAIQIHRSHWLVQQLDMRQLEFLHHQRAHREVALHGSEFIRGNNVRLEFVGGSLERATPIGATGEFYSYFTNPDPACWVSGVLTHQGIHFAQVYPGVDLQVYQQDKGIKYDWHLAAGADPACIRLAYSGAQRISEDNGRLVVEHELGGWQEIEPLAFQTIGGEKKSVRCRFQVSENEVTFMFPDGYDSCEPLVIDPLLIFSTYTGFSADNWGSTATPGENGTAYSAGVTIQTGFGDTFPATAGSFRTTYGGIYDVGILKYDSLGRKLLYAAFLGGARSESAHSLVVAANQDLVVLGTTSSFDFPVSTNAYDRFYNGGSLTTNVITYELGSDIFISRIRGDGRQLLASTYLGGSANDGMNPTSSVLVANYGDELRGDVITDRDGNVLISSVTESRDIPIVGGFQKTYQMGDSDAYVAKLNPELSTVIWSTYLGGSLADASHTIAISADNTILVAGGTGSTNFPATPNAYQSSLAGDADGWMARLSSDGSTLLSATYTGTQQFDQVYFIDQDRAGSVFVYGQTTGAMPVTPGVYRNAGSGQFLHKYSADLKTLQLATVFGSGRTRPDISPTAFLVNDCDKIYMTGWGGRLNYPPNYWGTTTAGMPVTEDAYQKSSSGSDFYFIVLSADFRTLNYATYLGGGQSATHVDGGTSRFDKSGIVYHAVCSGCLSFNLSGGPSSDFPTTPNAFSRVNGSRNCNNAVFKFDLSSLRARVQSNSVTLKQPGLSRICLQEQIVFQNLSNGGRLFQWDLGDGTKLVKGDTSLVRHRYKAPGRYVVKLRAIDVGTCIGVDSARVVVDVLQVIGRAGNDVAVCQGNSVQLTATGGVSYRWENNQNRTILTGPNPVIRPEKSITYRVTIAEASGCTRIDTLVVTVVPGIDLKWEWNRMFSCTDLPTLSLNRVTEPLADETLFFDLGDGTTTEEADVKYTYARPGRYEVKLVGRKEFCVYESIQPIDIFPLTVPNVITPLVADGKNDRLQLVVGNQTLAAVGLRAQLIIVNRWGTSVFESEDYQNDWTGADVAAGVYFMEVRINEAVACKSWIQVIK
jgi:hypothetical protein